MSKLSKNILGKIQKEKITPLPTFLFWLREAGVWTAFFLAALIGGIALAVIFTAFQHFSLEILFDDRIGKLEFLLTVLPLSWAAMMGIFLFLGGIAARKSKRGYRYPLKIFALVNIAASIFFAAGVFVSGGHEMLPRVIGKYVPFFGDHEKRMEEVWTKPEMGRIAGEILSISEDRSFLLLDIEGKQWTVMTEEIPENFWEQRSELIKKEEKIRILGEQLSEEEFSAEKIFPFHRPKKREKGMRPPFEEGERPEFREEERQKRMPPEFLREER